MKPESFKTKLGKCILFNMRDEYRFILFITGLNKLFHPVSGIHAESQ